MADSSHTCVDHYILLLKYLSNHMHFKTNGYKRFPKTNSTDPRQRVPLSKAVILWIEIFSSHVLTTCAFPWKKSLGFSSLISYWNVFIVFSSRLPLMRALRIYSDPEHNIRTSDSSKTWVWRQCLVLYTTGRTLSLLQFIPVNMESFHEVMNDRGLTVVVDSLRHGEHI